MKTIIGIFSDKLDADRAIDQLETEGFSPRDLSIIFKGGSGTEDIGVKGGSIAEGVISGAATGGMLAGLAGILIGLGALTIPGVGVLLIGGPISSALGLTGVAATAVSAATTGVLAGGLVGSLIALGIPSDVAKVYERSIAEGAVLLAVPVNNNKRLSLVRSIFRDYNAVQTRIIGDIGQKYG